MKMRISINLNEIDQQHMNQIVSEGLRHGVHLNDAQAVKFAVRHVDLTEATKETFAGMKTRRTANQKP